MHSYIQSSRKMDHQEGSQSCAEKDQDVRIFYSGSVRCNAVLFYKSVLNLAGFEVCNSMADWMNSIYQRTNEDGFYGHQTYNEFAKENLSHRKVVETMAEIHVPYFSVFGMGDICLINTALSGTRLIHRIKITTVFINDRFSIKTAVCRSMCDRPLDSVDVPKIMPWFECILSMLLLKFSPEKTKLTFNGLHREKYGTLDYASLYSIHPFQAMSYCYVIYHFMLCG